MIPDKNNTYCHYPFKELAIKNYHGNKLLAAWPCCMMGNLPSEIGGTNSLIPDPHHYTPEELFQHPRYELLRNNLLNGVKDPACKVCWDQESRGLKSFRFFSNGAPDIEDGQLAVLDISTSNICNLRCRMCSPTSSNSLMIDYKEFSKKGEKYLDEIREVTNFFVKGSNFIAIDAVNSIQWQWLMENTEKIKMLKASGGEPFYDKKVLSLLDKYIETGNAKNTILNFHTNGTLIDDALIDKLNQFKSNVHNFSIDGFDKTYEYVRYPANFKELDKILRNYCKKIKTEGPLRVTMVLTSLNLFSVPNFVNWIYSVNNNTTVNFAEVYGFDRGTSLNRLPVSLLQRALEEIDKSHPLKPRDSKYDNLIIQIQNAINNNKENKELMLKEISYFDTSRNQNFRNFLDPILVQWLDS